MKRDVTVGNTMKESMGNTMKIVMSIGDCDIWVKVEIS